MRRVHDPNGVSWSVDVDWTGRRFGHHLGRTRAWASERRARRKGSSPSTGDNLSALWELSGCIPDELGVIGFVVFAIVAIVLLVLLTVFVGPWMIALLLEAGELLIFPIVAIGVISWRAWRKRPFAIQAQRDGLEVATWHVVGVRQARRTEKALADAVAAGGDASILFPELRTSST